MLLSFLAIANKLQRLPAVGLSFVALSGCAVDSRTPDTAEAAVLPGPSGALNANTGVAESEASEPSEPPETGTSLEPALPNMPLGACTDGDTAPCGPELEQGPCKFGVSTCSAGAWGECQGAILSAARDCTSPEDNDCDGQPDDTLDAVCICAGGSLQPCEEHPGLDGRGVCVAGQQSCLLGAGNTSSDWGACESSIGPTPEVCDNGVDDDCDGQTDQGPSCGACRNDPCQNGGVCQDIEGGYRCSCRGFLGDDCELPMFERLIPVAGHDNALLISLSDDGRRGAGFCLTPTRGGPPNTPVRWTAAEGFTVVAGYPSEPAQYISGDGASFADADVLAAGETSETLAALNSVGGELFESYSVRSINRNGSVLAGVATFTDGSIGHFRWSVSSGFLSLPTVGGSFDAPPVVSSDGSTVVGGDQNGAYRFTTATGLQTLVADGGATGVSSNGNVVVGTRSSESGTIVFRWTEATGAVDQPGECSRPLLSLDGNQLAVTCSDPFSGLPDVELGSGSARSRLVDALVADGAPDVPPRLDLLEVMSGDGKTLVGQYGDEETGTQFLWVARLR
jgi:hypothetical protein